MNGKIYSISAVGISVDLDEILGTIPRAAVDRPETSVKSLRIGEQLTVTVTGKSEKFRMVELSLA